MKFLKILTLATFLFCAYPAQAQSWLPKLQRTIKANTVSTSILKRSQHINANLQRQLSVLFQPPIAVPQPKQFQIPKTPKPVSFLVQTGPKSDKTASAFALKIDKAIIGVTAGHVMNNILYYHEPYMAFPTGNGQKTVMPIANWRITNRHGTDVAVFELPPEALEYVQPLEVLEQPVRSLQTASIAGFANNAPLWLPNEEILFTGAQRLLLRNTSHYGLDGMCGSPVMVDGKVAAVYVGHAPRERSLSYTWVEPIRQLFNKPLPDLHQAAPIKFIFPLVEDLQERGAIHKFGTMMKALNHPIAMLDPKDQLYSVSLVRDGFVKKSIYLGPLADPEHLENFFELQENDVLRIEVLPDGYVNQRKSPTFYDINVSTGEVSSFQR